MTQTSVDDKFEKILRQVRGLLANAEHPNTPPEMADSYRAKAEALMLKYRIEEATMVQQGIGTGAPLTPVWLRLSLNDITSEYGIYYRQIGGAVIHHVGAKAVIDYDYKSGSAILEACGFSTDLRYADLLLTSCLLEFGKRLEPKPDPNATDEENAWNLRAAGWERKRIARELFGDWTTENEMKAKNRKVTNLIKKHGAAIGEDASALLGRGNNMVTFRESYAAGFVNTINSRLWRMREQATAETGGALVPVSRKEAVEEAFYGKYPQYRPKPFDPNAPAPKAVKIPKQREKSINMRAYDRGRTAAYSVDLGPNGSGRRIEGK